MVDITAPVTSAQLFIEEYRKGAFQVRGKEYVGPMILMPHNIATWTPDDVHQLTEDDFKEFLEDHADQVELLLIGCGDRMVMPPAKLREALKKHNIAMDMMDTGAACRTYNVLLGEGRKIAAALYPTTATK